MSDVTIVYINHDADHMPGDAEIVSADVARQLGEANVARLATEEEAEAVAAALEAAIAAEAGEGLSEDDSADKSSRRGRTSAAE